MTEYGGRWDREDLNSGIRIALLGGFAIHVDGRRVALPPSAERLLAILSIQPDDLDRAVLIGLLYPDGRRSHAAANLRSVLWRVSRAAGRPVIEARGHQLGLSAAVHVDLRQWMQRARSVTSWTAESADNSTRMIEMFVQELLPAWNDDWLVLERQRWNHVRLHALERLSDESVAAGRYLDALEAGYAAIAIEPYRESAYRTLIRVYLAEGNSASALETYQRCQRLLMRDLGVRPTAQIQALLRSITGE